MIHDVTVSLLMEIPRSKVHKFTAIKDVSEFITTVVLNWTN